MFCLNIVLDVIANFHLHFNHQDVSFALSVAGKIEQRKYDYDNINLDNKTQINT